MGESSPHHCDGICFSFITFFVCGWVGGSLHSGSFLASFLGTPEVILIGMECAVEVAFEAAALWLKQQPWCL